MTPNAHTPPSADARGGVECGRRPKPTWSAKEGSGAAATATGETSDTEQGECAWGGDYRDDH